MNWNDFEAQILMAGFDRDPAVDCWFSKWCGDHEWYIRMHSTGENAFACEGFAGEEQWQWRTWEEALEAIYWLLEDDNVREFFNYD
jgi:hypothetical protein